MDAFNVNSAAIVTNYVTINKARACFQIVPRAAARAETSPSSDAHLLLLPTLAVLLEAKQFSISLIQQSLLCVYFQWMFMNRELWILWIF